MHTASRRGGEVRNILVDFGYQSGTLLNNISVLNLDPASLDALVLSHGHYDHFGGLVGFLSANKGKLKNGLPFFVGERTAFACVKPMPPVWRARPQGDHGREPLAHDGGRAGR